MRQSGCVYLSTSGENKTQKCSLLTMEQHAAVEASTTPNFTKENTFELTP